MTDKEIIEVLALQAKVSAGLALQVEQLSEDIRGLRYAVQDLVAVTEESVALISH